MASLPFLIGFVRWNVDSHVGRPLWIWRKDSPSLSFLTFCSYTCGVVHTSPFVPLTGVYQTLLGADTSGCWGYSSNADTWPAALEGQDCLITQ